VDAFGLIFAITSSFLWILVSSYSIGYMRTLRACPDKILRLFRISHLRCGGHSTVQNDVKRLCACSTISQISYSLLGLGALTVCSIEGGLFYFLSHILGKAILFSTAGIVVYITGIRDMNKMGGLIHKMPISAVLWIAAASILTGVPLTSGFTGKWTLFTGVFAAYPTYVGRSIAILGILSTILTGIYTFWAAKRIFFGPLKLELANDTKIRGPPLAMSVPLLILAVISFIIGLYPEPFINLFHSVIGLL